MITMTIRQRQCLLAYLGFYTGTIDGKWGTRSKKATKAFQAAYGIPDDGEVGSVTEKALKDAVANGMPKKKDWDSFKYFKRDEFHCKCGKCGGFPVEPDLKLVALLEKIREHFGVPVTITSGVRCKTHNTNCGGATSSQHLKGTAADIKVKGVAPEKVAAYAETLLPGTGGIGRYETFTHVDVRKNKSRWNG
jgi:uncharacterized protein YcbK (DUF882 family)